MQSTGHTSTHAVSLVPIQGSVMMKGIVSFLRLPQVRRPRSQAYRILSKMAAWRQQAGPPGQNASRTASWVVRGLSAAMMVLYVAPFVRKKFVTVLAFVRL